MNKNVPSRGNIVWNRCDQSK